MNLETPIRLLIADDHQILRNGITSIIESYPDILIVGEAETGTQLIEKYLATKPDVILTDVSMPDMNGFEALKKILRKDPHAKALFLTMHDTEDYILYANKVGAKGLVSKNTIKGELIFAIKAIHAGEKYFGKVYNEEKLKEIEHNFRKLTGQHGDEYIHLTSREREILIFVSQGKTSDVIAKHYGLSKKSIDHYRSRMMFRLKLKTLPEFITYAVKYAMISKALGGDQHGISL